MRIKLLLINGILGLPVLFLAVCYFMWWVLPTAMRQIFSLSVYQLVFLFYVIFANKIVLIIYCLVSGLFLLAGIIYAKRFWLIAFYLIILAAFVFLGNILADYHPGIVFNDNTKYYLADPPQGLDRIQKSMFAQTEWKDTYYEIIGWENDITLIFKKWHKRKYNENIHEWEMVGEGETLVYPIGSKPRLVDSQWEITNQFCEFKDCVGPYVKDGWNITPKKVYMSPDGKKLAFITEHIYGPQDIIVVIKE